MTQREDNPGPDPGTRPAAAVAALDYQRIFDAAPAPFLVLATDAGFTIQGASEGYLRATHTRRETIVGRALFEVFPENPDDPGATGRANLRASLARVLATRSPDAMAVQKYMIHRPASEGGGAELRYWSPVNAPVVSEHGEIACIVHRVEDVTAQVLADQALRRAEDALRESGQRKDEFIATLSHELRNPLAPLRNALSLLRSAGERDAATVRMHDMMERQIDHLVRLLDDLLEISRISRGVLELRLERVELASVLGSVIETRAQLIRDAGHELEVELTLQPMWLDGDPVRLAQIIGNLLDNAARFTDRGGRVALVAAVRDGEASISVRDTGRGFAPELTEQLFEMFRKAGRSSGLGLGLALARRLAELHGGTVTGTSPGEGRGAEFVLRLPLAAVEDPPPGRDTAPQAREAAALVPEAVRDTPAVIRCRVLVADDNRDAADTLADVLRELGGEVAVAYDGEQAVELARTFQPDLALLDIGMPKLDGYEAAQRIRSEAGARPIRVAALTGWGQADDRRRTREAGFDDHLVKPAQIAALRDLLASVRFGNNR